MVKYVLEINGKDFSSLVERDSYNTGLIPVTTEPVTTLDGIDHVALIRTKGILTVNLNPQTATDTAELFNELLKWPLQVKYHCLQRNLDVYAAMKPTLPTVRHLSYCLYMGKRWNEISEISLEEL